MVDDPAPTARLTRSAIAALLLAVAAPGWSAAEVDPVLLKTRPLPFWDQEQREFGFANWDRLFAARVIAHGPQVRALSPGAPLATFAAGGTGALQLQRNIEDFHLKGIVVLHRGQLRLERYAPGHSAAGRWVSFSLAKSLTSTLVGAAVKDGFVGSVDDAVTRYIPELRDSAYDGVTLRHLLTMSSGVKWNEDYKDPAADVALFHSMPVDPGLDATVSYMKKLRRDVAPGDRWLYNTGETNLIGVALSRATRKNLASYASEKIWAPYGMESNASWMLDRSGHEHAGCCIQATTRDYARLGQFMLEGALIDGQPILPDGWLQAATRKQVDIGRPGFGYGYQWWTRDNGMFNALGIHGQQIHIDPARGLVIAVNSATPDARPSEASTGARLALFEAIRAAIDAEPSAQRRAAASSP
jgi:CubicO group peptidase (beta-lactamase class C family)